MMFSTKMRACFSAKNLLKLGAFLATFLITGLALAQDEGAMKGIAKIAQNVTGSFGSIAQLFLAIAYIAGVGFAVAAIFKFKQHKDNPTQIPLGTPIALLAIAVSLIFLGYFIKPLGETLGATEQQAVGPSGKGAERVLPGMK